MKLHELKPAKGATKRNKRLGRGQGSGGSTAGRGHKGAKSRSGYSRKIGFEGGQMPLQRRVPKFGFTNNNKVYFKCVNLDTLEGLVEKTKSSDINLQLLIDNGVVGKKDKVKVLGRGELKAKVNVEAHAFSATAIKAIETAGGKATKV
ncbi:MAG TPA: 50S ribosomal protein L15 [Cyclobacteriaceae bacterium]|nr:50S ribosomal protein L15 [Cyclobacteriaceae bacterium]MCB9237224.1 50S ribosomal protein L15 [Flammeovirgaceae bacterium]MCB0499958.1 50S ribosomal protein L15 [Cyclobacteriaceae bacterium]MCO5270934.1 50S ribosomal protein L15 [Cyclobacteriaceae bacterium]MCW5901780.1 50S ribosomal protein L15 [Cyclobacteriaceae bacterium]